MLTYPHPNKIPTMTCLKVCILQTIRCTENMIINAIHTGSDINLYKYNRSANIVIASEWPDGIPMHFVCVPFF